MKQFLNLASLAVIFLSVGSPALSQEMWVQPHFYTGEKLLQSCQMDPGTIAGSVGLGFCLGYIIGVVDASTGLTEHGALADGTNVLPLCLPLSVSNAGIIQGIVLKYMKDHPERLGQSASNIIRASLESFGCRSGWPDGITPPEPKK